MRLSKSVVMKPADRVVMPITRNRVFKHRPQCLGNRKCCRPRHQQHLHDTKAQQRGSEFAAGEDELQRTGLLCFTLLRLIGEGWRSQRADGAGGESPPAGTYMAGKAGPPTGAKETQLATDQQPHL